MYTHLIDRKTTCATHIYYNKKHIFLYNTFTRGHNDKVIYIGTVFVNVHLFYAFNCWGTVPKFTALLFLRLNKSLTGSHVTDNCNVLFLQLDPCFRLFPRPLRLSKTQSKSCGVSQETLN